MFLQRLLHFLVTAPRWLLLGLIFYAPWAYGCTRESAISVLNPLMLLVLILWLMGNIVRRLRPVVHPVLLVAASFLVLQGWWMITNAQYDYDRVNFRFVSIPCIWSWAPGVVDRGVGYDDGCLRAMVRITGLLGIACFVCDLSQRREWRSRIWWTVGACGASVILFGLIERVLGAPGIFWDEARPGEHFFATYYYHGNAGAFINLVFPVITGLAFTALRTRDANASRAIWFPAAFLALAGSVATASKAAIVITALLLLSIVIWRFRLLKEVWKGLASPAFRVIAAIAVIVVLFSVGWLSWDRMMTRWTKEPWAEYSFGDRMISYQASMKIIPDSGAWGLGPGNFSITFPHYTNEFGDRIRGFWRYAHEDYLQTIIEWGWIGAGVWAIILFGGAISAIRTYREKNSALTGGDLAMLFTTLLGLAGVYLHSTMDFPLQIASLQLIVAVYLGLAWGSRSWATNAPARQSSRD